MGGRDRQGKGGMRGVRSEGMGRREAREQETRGEVEEEGRGKSLPPRSFL